MPLQLDTTNISLINSSYNLTQLISQNESINKILTSIENYFITDNIEDLIDKLDLLVEELNLLVSIDIGFT